MKLFNQDLEFTAIRSMCESPSKYKNKLVAVLQLEHFHNPTALEAATRIKTLVRTSGECPTWQDLCTDPVLRENSRKLLAKVPDRKVESDKNMAFLVKRLNSFYQLRKLYYLSEKINESLLKDKVDIDQLLEFSTDAIAKARARNDSNTPIYHIGRGNNSVGLLKHMLDGQAKEYVPTGFDAFDSTNGGIMYGSLMLIGGSTGGGKSSLAIALLKNMALHAESVAYVPLEMTEDETMMRLASNLSSVPLSKIIQKKVTKDERAKIIQSFRDYNAKLAKNDSRYTIFSPEEDMTADEILMMLKPYNHRVILIDYISLLKGVDGDDAWQQLGKVARMCKIYAKNNNCIIILLVQISEEGKIRYSKAVQEHANNAWFFVATDASRDAGVMDIKQTKARNQSMFPFQLAFDPSVMQITDVDKAAPRSDSLPDPIVANDESAYLSDLGDDNDDN